MSASLIFCIALAYFVVAYFTYGGFLKHVFAIDPRRPTPATTQFDGLDYVPTRRSVLFAHHFASIAGPGPIVGPIMAAYFGWLPALIWILVGCVFVGAFHDFAAMVMSVRNRGRSISYLMEKLMGLTGRQLFLIFCFVCLILVVGIFTLLIAGMFAAVPSVATASLIFILIAPAFAFLNFHLGLSLAKTSLIFVPLVFLSVYVGASFPLHVDVLFGLEGSEIKNFWIAVLAVYIFIASVLPVQWMLQPRDYLNSYLLYGMLLLGLCAIVAYNPEVRMNSFEGFVAVTASGQPTALVPALFIFIACGACSGFHALVASGTTSKQIKSEADLLPIGYGAMILEGVLGVMALVAVMCMEPADFTEQGKNPTLAFASGISSFCVALSINVEYAKIFISLAVSAFMMTSLDTATRLGRFLWQELFLPRQSKRAGDAEPTAADLSPARRFIVNPYLAAFMIVGLAMTMALTGSAGSIWPLFGASNQLMSALTLLAVTLYLLFKGSRWYLAFVPMCFMMVMSLWGVIDVVRHSFGNAEAGVDPNYTLLVAGIFLTVMALLMVGVGTGIIFTQLKNHLAGKPVVSAYAID